MKKSAYLLPVSDESREDFEWLKREIEQGGGEAWIFECDPVAGFSRESLSESFRALRAADFEALAAEARDQLAAPDPHRLQKLRQKFEQVCRIDFFGAPGRKEVEAIMTQIEKRAAAPEPGELKGRTWVTRRGVKVDRIASAWLIRRFIDPAAKFRFVDPQSYQHASQEIRFDMFEGEFTHDGDLCTFEVLLKRAGLDDAALASIAEIVHDIDLKDAKFQRAEAAGIDGLIQGIAVRHSEDERRIEEGSMLFEALYARGPQP